MRKTIRQRMRNIIRRELRIFSRRPVFLFVMIIAPILCTVFFTSLMQEGLPKRLPAAIVDEDNTRVSRLLTRIIDSFEMTDITRSYSSFGEAREAMQRGDIYAFFYIPQGTTREAINSLQPRVSFYTNDAFLVPANLLMKDMKTTSELVGLALTREILYAKGAPEDRIMGIIQPIAMETHPVGNPTLDYSVYLSNMLVPGIMILLIMLTATYSIGIEWKLRSQKIWYMMSGRSPLVAITAKLLPQTLHYGIMMTFISVWFFVYCGFPCQCGIGVMIALGWLTVLAAQGFAVFLFGLMAGEMRLSMCICSLWGILSFSLAGFTYPVTAMHPVLHSLAMWFPLRHYYLIYVNQALDGFSLRYVWTSVVWLLVFCHLPWLMRRRYHRAFMKFQYLP